MICEKLQIEVQRFLLQLFGLWPYKKSQRIQRLVVLQIILLYSILVTFIIFQVFTIVTSKCTWQTIVELISIISVFITYVVSYNMYVFNKDMVKHFLEVMQHIYDGLKDEKEINIIKKYGMISKYITIISIVLMVGSTTILTTALFWTQILDIILPLNESRPHFILQIMTQNFIDPEKYYYIREIHILLAYIVGEMILMATGTMSITYMQYACGMLMIASYRIEQAIKVCASKHNKKKNNLAFERIVYAVDIHRKAIEFANNMLTRWNTSLFFIIWIQVLSACCNLFRIVEGILLGYHFSNLITPFFSLATSYSLMFGVNYLAQQITDSNNYIFVTAYNVDWYIAPLQIQKFILFILQRGTTAYHLKVGGLLEGSLESFAMLMSSSMSYFTLLYSTSQ